MELTCAYCKTVFYRSKQRANCGRNWYDFCSPEHYWQWKKGRPNPHVPRKIRVKCDFCKKILSFLPKNPNRNRHNFCDATCWSDWRKKKDNTRARSWYQQYGRQRYEQLTRLIREVEYAQHVARMERNGLVCECPPLRSAA